MGLPPLGTTKTDASGVKLIETQDAVILGRRSYDEWAAFWPDSEIQPFTSFINAVPKYVTTSTPLEREWTNSRVTDGGLVDLVRHLKGRPGGDNGVHGSISVTRTLLAADVVDSNIAIRAQRESGRRTPRNFRANKNIAGSARTCGRRLRGVVHPAIESRFDRSRERRVNRQIVWIEKPKAAFTAEDLSGNVD